MPAIAFLEFLTARGRGITFPIADGARTAALSLFAAAFEAGASKSLAETTEKTPLQVCLTKKKRRTAFSSASAQEWLTMLERRHGSHNALLTAVSGGSKHLGAALQQVYCSEHIAMSRDFWLGCEAAALHYDGGSYMGKHVQLGFGLHLAKLQLIDLSPVVARFFLRSPARPGVFPWFGPAGRAPQPPRQVCKILGNLPVNRREISGTISGTHRENPGKPLENQGNPNF